MNFRDESSEHAGGTPTDSPGGGSGEVTQSAPTVRPKLNLAPRTLPVSNETADTLAAASSIFGSARPVNTAAREREIEEKLRRDRELAAAAKIAAGDQIEQESGVGDHEGEEHASTNIESASSPVAETQTVNNRSHKTSVSSDYRGDTSGEFQTVGSDRYHQQSQGGGAGHHGSKNRPNHDRSGGDRRSYKNNEGGPGRHQKLATSESFTASGISLCFILNITFFISNKSIFASEKYKTFFIFR